MQCEDAASAHVLDNNRETTVERPQLKKMVLQVLLLLPTLAFKNRQNLVRVRTCLVGHSEDLTVDPRRRHGAARQ